MSKKRAKSAAEPAPAGGDPARFEEALEELREIVSEMDTDRVPLDELLKKYERGTQLLKSCQAHIGAARIRIEEIAGRGENGEVGLEPFDGQAGETTETAVDASSPDDPETTTADDEIELL